MVTGEGSVLYIFYSYLCKFYNNWGSIVPPVSCEYKLQLNSK